jgi:hypothetical protein
MFEGDAALSHDVADDSLRIGIERYGGPHQDIIASMRKAS